MGEKNLDKLMISPHVGQSSSKRFLVCPYMGQNESQTNSTFMGLCVVNVFKQNQHDAMLDSGIYYYKCSTCFRWRNRLKHVQHLYEDWNFNSGNYLFTTDTKDTCFEVLLSFNVVTSIVYNPLPAMWKS